MKILKWFGNLIGHFKYLIVIVLGVAWVGFADEESVMSRIKIDVEIAELEDEIEGYRTKFKADSAMLHALNTDTRAAVKIARERYFMKADNEDIFVLSDD